MVSSKEISGDNFWWQRLREDNQEALAYFYEKYADWLLAYGLSIVYNRDIVRDAIQELFLQIWNRRQTLSDPDSPKHYLLVCLRRLILSAVRKERTLSDTIEETADDPVAEDDLAIEQAVLSAVRSLPARQQELIFLKFYEKMTYEQIETVTGLEYQVLRNTIYKAVKNLRIALVKNAEWLTSVFFLTIPSFF